MIRLIVIGEVNAGKTTFINAAAKEEFKDLGRAPKVKDGKDDTKVGKFLIGQKEIEIRVRDTGDLERFALLSRGHF